MHEPELTQADITNLKLIVEAKSAAGNYLEFERVLGIYGQWGRSGCLPKMPRSLECKIDNEQRSFALTDNMMLLIDSEVNRLRTELTDRPWLYLAFREQFLSDQNGVSYEEAKRKYIHALRAQHWGYSVRRRQMDAARFVKDLHRAVSEYLVNL